MACNTESVVVNHGVLYGASDCESWWCLLCQWLWMMVCYAESIVVNYDVLCLWIMVSYAEPVAVNHGLLCYASGWVMVSYAVPGMWVMVCNAEPVVVNHGVLCWASGCEFMCAILNRIVVNHVLLYWADCDLVMVCHAAPLDMNDMSQWLWIMTCYGVPVVVNHGV
jgi:hypothetical protein